MRKFIFFISVCAIAFSNRAQSVNEFPALRISEIGRFIEYDNRAPFFWLGDTGWLLFSKLNREEAAAYLDDRADKGFNVVQVMVLHQLKLTNVYGDSALINGDVSNQTFTDGILFENGEEYDYWDHIDYCIELAMDRGIYMAMVPVWGSNVKSGKIDQRQAVAYATWLAQRYAGKSNIIWLNGGDTRGDQNTEIWNAIGTALDKYAPDQLITFHPFGRTQSSMWFHNATWLDFNMFQSGHRRYDQDDSELGYGQDNWKYVRDDYALTPAKPTLDGEPSYEGIPQGLHDPSEPFWNENDMRRYAYWSVFAGGCGFTYGHSAVMQMHKPGDENPAYGVREYWTEALNAEGARQMKHLKQLMLSHSHFDRIPDQSLIASGQGEKYDYQVATRGAHYALIYTYNGRELSIKMGKIEGKKVKATWYNPRNGKYTIIGVFQNNIVKQFDPPGEVEDGNDWILVLESVNK